MDARALGVGDVSRVFFGLGTIRQGCIQSLPETYRRASLPQENSPKHPAHRFRKFFRGSSTRRKLSSRRFLVCLNLLTFESFRLGPFPWNPHTYRSITNPQLARDTIAGMAKKTAVPEPVERPYKTTGLHLPSDLWELLNRVAFERAKTRGGRASVSALLVDMIELHRKELEKELAAGSR